jgi:signal transduction histidine kinase
LVNGKIDAVLVFDFSMQGHAFLIKILKELESNYKKILMFFLAIFVIIMLFSYIDFKREKEKDKALMRVEQINKTLKEKVENAVRENRQKDQAMFQQSRLAQMGEMISMIAHQWRQPLAAISSTSASINLKARLNKLDKDSAIELSDKISNYSLHLSSTIDDFRGFFKDRKIKSETDFNELVDSVLNIVEISITNKNIKIIKELNCSEKFSTYPNELKQVLLNLIKNAEDVLIEKNVKNPYIKIKSYKKDDKIVLEIIDNGGGVDENIMEKIFDPYFSTKNKRDGTGLGLYMSKTIIEEHCGGKIFVQNGEEGAIFKIVFGGMDE